MNLSIAISFCWFMSCFISGVLHNSCSALAFQTNCGNRSPLCRRRMIPTTAHNNNHHNERNLAHTFPSSIRQQRLHNIDSWNLHQSKSNHDDDEENSSDYDFMASLQSRIQQVQELENKMPLVVLDCMLPRQTMKIQVNNPLLMELVRCQMQKENPTFGMLGMAILNTGEKIHLTTGVEVEIVDRPKFVTLENGISISSSGSGGSTGGVLLELKAKRRFVITGQVENSKQGWTEARVQYLDSRKQEQEEVQKGGGSDKMAVARAIMKARELTMPNANMENNASLVDRWIELARKNERQVGQIDRLLEDLGDIPPEDEPSERALWIGALINPLPAMGVAMEIRPALLTATTAEKRVDVACDAILKSIRHMEGTRRMW